MRLRATKLSAHGRGSSSAYIDPTLIFQDSMDSQGNWVNVVSDSQAWNGSFTSGSMTWENTSKIAITNLRASTGTMRIVATLDGTDPAVRLLGAYNTTVSANSRAAGHVYTTANSLFFIINQGYVYSTNSFFTNTISGIKRASHTYELELVGYAANDGCIVRLYDTSLGFRQLLAQRTSGTGFSTSFADFIGIQSTTGISRIRVYNTDVTAWSSQTIAYSNAAIYWSENNWYDSGSSKITHCSGSYFKFKTNSNKIAIVCPTTTIYDRPMEINWSVDGVEQISYPLPGNTTGVSELILSESLGTSLKEIKVRFSTMCQSASGLSYQQDRWTTASPHRMVITGVKLDSTASISATTQRPLKMVVLGDSISERAVSSIADKYAYQGYASVLADSINAEYSQIAYSYLGLEYALASNNVPKLASSWNLHFQGQSRLTTGALTPQPDIIAVNIGTNDNNLGGPTPTVTFQASYITLLAAIRTAAPLSKIVAIVPFAGYYATQIANAVTANGANTYLTNLGAPGIAYVTSPYTDDGLHPNVAGSAGEAALIKADWISQGII